MNKIKFKLYRDGKHVGFEESLERYGNLQWATFDTQGKGYVWIPHDHKEPFTGLYDKDGNEIYCGDLLRYSDRKRVERVVWRGIKFMLSIGKTYFDLWYDNNKQCVQKIVGNIYEDPELLENQDED